MKRIISLLLAIGLAVSMAAPASAYNVSGHKWAPYSVGGHPYHVYVCLDGAWPGGLYGTQANIAIAGVKAWNAVGTGLWFDETYNRQCLNISNQYVIHFGTPVNDMPAATSVSIDSRGYITSAVTSFNQYYLTLVWWNTSLQSCTNTGDHVNDCQIDGYTIFTHEAGHSMGLAHRPSPDSAGHPCQAGFSYTSTAAACLGNNSGVYGVDVMFTYAADGYYRRLTSDDKAGINYLY